MAGWRNDRSDTDPRFCRWGRTYWDEPQVHAYDQTVQAEDKRQTLEDVCDKNGIAWRALATEGGPWR